MNRQLDPPTSGYGNIYTPHAGSMIIQVQRESGLQNRTIILSPRQVQILGFVTSRTGKILAAIAATVLIVLVLEAVRVPFLSARMSRLQYTASRLDTLEHSLIALQRRYDQVEQMLGAKPTPGLTPAAAAATSTPGDHPKASIRAHSSVPEPQSKSSVPMD